MWFTLNDFLQFIMYMTFYGIAFGFIFGIVRFLVFYWLERKYY